MSPDLSNGAHGTKPCVIVYTHSLLDKSMTFIASHANALRRHDAFYVGAHRSKCGIELPSARVETVNFGGITGTAQEYLFRRYGYAPRFFRKLAEQRPVLVHAHFGTSGPTGLTIAEQLGIPLIVTFHGKDATMTAREAASSRRGREYLEHRDRLIAKCDRVIAVSDFIKQKVIEQGFHPDKVIVHRNGIDTDFFQPSQMTREPIILFVGRFVEKKGAEYLLQACKIIRDMGISAKLVLIGDGPLRRRLEETARQTHLDVQFTGFLALDEVKVWLNKAMVVAVPSVTASNGDCEGLPTVVLEAQAMATPVVATRHAGIPEGVIDGKTALLVDERDARSLAEAISILIENPAEAARIGATAREFVRRHFDISSQVNGLETIYETIRETSLRSASRAN
jgi:colanic acid/amylovoran biosynthesis glycosyltransferase